MSPTMHASSSNMPTRRFFVHGRPFELWENPDHAFGWAPEDLQQYANEGGWEMLFNALVIRAATTEIELD